jgi:hypothetical protein
VVKVGRAALAAFTVAVLAPAARAEAPALSPAAPQAQATPDRGAFGALWVMRLGTHRFQGAGLDGGYRYGWFAPLYRIGFVQNGYEPISGSALLALERTRRLFLDLEIDGQFQVGGGAALAVGVGVGVLDDIVDITSMNGFDWTTARDERWRVRPLLGATLAGPLFQASVTAYVGSDPEVHVSLGVSWGRHRRR